MDIVKRANDLNTDFTKKWLTSQAYGNSAENWDLFLTNRGFLVQYRLSIDIATG